MNTGMINLTLKMGPGKENQPELNDFLREHLNNAINAGFKIIHLPRIGGFVNNEVEQYITKLSGEEFKNYYEIAVEVAKRIESLNAGFKWFEEIGLKYEQKVFDGIRKAPDSEDNNIAKAVAEWADGDTIACAVGIGSDYICTKDDAKGAGVNSVFSKQNIEILSEEFKVKLIKPIDLENMFPL